MSVAAHRLRKCSCLWLAVAVSVGCTTTSRHDGPAAATLEERLPASFPRLEDYGLQDQVPFDYSDRAPYYRGVDAWFAPPPADEPQPKLVCDEPNAPSQTIWKGQTLSCSWEIRNEGQATLRVQINT